MSMGAAPAEGARGLRACAASRRRCIAIPSRPRCARRSGSCATPRGLRPDRGRGGRARLGRGVVQLPRLRGGASGASGGDGVRAAARGPRDGWPRRNPRRARRAHWRACDPIGRTRPDPPMHRGDRHRALGPCIPPRGPAAVAIPRRNGSAGARVRERDQPGRAGRSCRPGPYGRSPRLQAQGRFRGGARPREPARAALGARRLLRADGRRQPGIGRPHGAFDGERDGGVRPGLDRGAPAGRSSVARMAGARARHSHSPGGWREPRGPRGFRRRPGGGRPARDPAGRRQVGRHLGLPRRGAQGPAIRLRYCPHYLGAGVGLLASAHLLAAAGGGGMLEIDANRNPLRTLTCGAAAQVRDGCIVLDDAPGLGATPDPALLREFRVSHR